jgi:hypothetical protein
MKFVEKRLFADPEVAARKLVELANTFEPVHDGRIYIEKINGPSCTSSNARQLNTRSGLSMRSPRAGW